MLDVLNTLAKFYGPDTPLDYVSDLWGSEPQLLTPQEVIDMHQDLGWSDVGYSVLIARNPGDTVLKDENGAAILKLPHVIYECGICDCYHPWQWDGDCREDASRFPGPEEYAEMASVHVDTVQIRTWEERCEADEGSGKS